MQVHDGEQGSSAGATGKTTSTTRTDGGPPSGTDRLQSSEGERPGLSPRDPSGLTVVGHGHPRVPPAPVELGVKVAALDVAEGGVALGAVLQVAETHTLPFAHAVLALVLGPVGRAGAGLSTCTGRAHCGPNLLGDPGHVSCPLWDERQGQAVDVTCTGCSESPAQGTQRPDESTCGQTQPTQVRRKPRPEPPSPPGLG